MIDHKLVKILYVVIINFNELKPFKIRIELYRSTNRTILFYIY